MASRLVNNYRGKTGILSITFRDVYVTISDAQKLTLEREFLRINGLNCSIRGISATSPSMYSPNMSTQFYVNKHCIPNMVKLVACHGRSLSW
jgi:hypothetical protein